MTPWTRSFGEFVAAVAADWVLGQRNSVGRAFKGRTNAVIPHMVRRSGPRKRRSNRMNRAGASFLLALEPVTIPIPRAPKPLMPNTLARVERAASKVGSPLKYC